jgi:hypothetical protein
MPTMPKCPANRLFSLTGPEDHLQKRFRAWPGESLSCF